MVRSRVEGENYSCSFAVAFAFALALALALALAFAFAFATGGSAMLALYGQSGHYQVQLQSPLGIP